MVKGAVNGRQEQDTVPASEWGGPNNANHQLETPTLGMLLLGTFL